MHKHVKKEYFVGSLEQETHLLLARFACPGRAILHPGGAGKQAMWGPSIGSFVRLNRPRRRSLILDRSHILSFPCFLPLRPPPTTSSFGLRLLTHVPPHKEIISHRLHRQFLSPTRSRHYLYPKKGLKESRMIISLKLKSLQRSCQGRNTQFCDFENCIQLRYMTLHDLSPVQLSNLCRRSQ